MCMAIWDEHDYPISQGEYTELYEAGVGLVIERLKPLAPAGSHAQRQDTEL